MQYARLVLRGDAMPCVCNPREREPMKVCEVARCERRAVGRDKRWCGQHQEVQVYAEWRDPDSATTYSWAQATIDNRRSRVLARIRRYGIPCDEATLVIREA